MPRSSSKTLNTTCKASRERNVSRNMNENHSAESSEARGRKCPSVRSKVVKPCSSKESSKNKRRHHSVDVARDQDDLDESEDQQIETVTFEENDNVVEIAVRDEDD